jgi:tetraacyldisaccharide 4'-kinase
VGIATRGHGRRGRGTHWVTADSDPLAVGDEPVLLAQRSGAPVCVAARRLEAARMLRARGCELILCDDGLQHLALRRDLGIVVVDGQRGFGNGALLPAGPLREPADRLRGFDLIVINGQQAPPGLPAHSAVLRMSLNPGGARALRGAARQGLEAWRGQSVHAVAGIGHPQQFFASLRAAGIDVQEHAFADHHRFCARDFDFGDRRSIVMTEKDAVKCQAFADSRMWVVPVTAGFSPTDAARLLAAVQRVIRGEREL